MNIVYYCYGSAHSSVLAAGIHLGQLPTDRVPKAEEIEKLPRYDEATPSQIGTVFYMGRDEFGSHIYIIGMGSHRVLVKRAILSFLQCSGVDTSNLILVSTLENINFKTRVGGFSSRRLGFVRFGRPLTIKGLQEKYHFFCELVAKVKGKEAKSLNKA